MRSATGEPNAPGHPQVSGSGTSQRTGVRSEYIAIHNREGPTLETVRYDANRLIPSSSDVSIRIAALPEPPSPASLQETHRLLSSLAGDVAMLAAFAPDRLAAIMRSHGITAQLHDGGVRLIWPESLGYFFEG